MFQAIGRFSVRFRWIIVVVWIVAVPIVVKNLPSLSSVSQSDNSAFLPSNTKSEEASNLASPFEGNNTTETATIVASRNNGQLTNADNLAINSVETAVGHIQGVNFVRDEGTSKDGQARQAVVNIGALKFSPNGGADTELVSSIRSKFTSVAVPSGLSFHLTGSLAEQIDQNASSNKSDKNTQNYSIIFIIILLLLVYRSLLAPFVTILPAGLSLAIAGPVIAEAAKHGLQVSPITQILLIVLMLGAGTDYGIFLVFRVREELRRGHEPKEAVKRALSRVGLSITFSALTVSAALLSLLLASFGLYKWLGPALAIALGIMLLASLTFLPALLAILGRAVFWPTRVKGGEKVIGFWGALADRVIKYPVVTLSIGVIIFGGLAIGITGFRTTGFNNTSSPPTSSDSAQGATVLTQHFSSSSNDPESLIFVFAQPVWSNLTTIQTLQNELSQSSIFKSVCGPLTCGSQILLAPTELTKLHGELPPPSKLTPIPPSNLKVPVQLYQLYRSTAQFISPDGKTVMLEAILNAGPTGSTPAMRAVPSVRAELTSVQQSIGATNSGLLSRDAFAYDISHIATDDLKRIVPVVLIIIAILLGVMLRSAVAPFYLIITVGLSYLASLGFAMIVFVHIKGDDGLNFVLPFLMFVFSMALGEDYNILVMSRIREEAEAKVSLKEAVTRAIGFTGSTVTSAGIILAGTFGVLAFVGGNQQIEQIGYGVAFGILLDTLFVRTLLVPSIVVLLDRWNWWPSALSRPHPTKAK